MTDESTPMDTGKTVKFIEISGHPVLNEAGESIGEAKFRAVGWGMSQITVILNIPIDQLKECDLHFDGHQFTIKR